MLNDLEPDHSGLAVAVTDIEARNPDGAIEQAQKLKPELKDEPRLVAVPESSWHEFRRATTFERVRP